MLLFADTLIVIGMATASLGTIHEANGPQEHIFWLRNACEQAVTIHNGYTSCGCTTIATPSGEKLGGTTVEPGDSTAVTLRFNPRGKGGEFMEVATIEYGTGHKRLQLSLVGTCITSEETLLQQFPVRISDDLRLSTNHFDMGRMSVGESKERGVLVLHRNEGDRKERIPINFRVDETMGKGLQHIPYPITIETNGQKHTIQITLDVYIR